MKLKISVNLNRVTIDWKSDFEKAQLYHQKHGVEIDFVFKETDLHAYVSEQILTSNGWYQYVLKGSEGLVQLDPTADMDMFVFDAGEWINSPNRAKTPSGNCFIHKTKPFINVETFQYDHDMGITWVQIAHEIMHGLVKMANLRGFVIPDVMDTYRDNMNPDSPTGNFAEQWKLLGPFLAPSGVTITRNTSGKRQTLGTLRAKNQNGEFGCKTLELPSLNNTQNISCIPTGIYNVTYTFSLRMLKYTYEVQKVPGRSGIRMHSANFFSDLFGCIALGDNYEDINYDGEVDVINSRITVNAFEKFMNKEPFVLTIK